MRKVKFYILGFICLILALIFFVVPGPSIVFLLCGLLCFSIVDERARSLLRKTQKVFKAACVKMDNVIKK